MAAVNARWQVAMRRFFCSHSWEPIGWAMDMREGYCRIDQCTHCGLRRQSKEADGAVPIAAHAIGRISVELASEALADVPRAETRPLSRARAASAERRH